jgi:SAM-dependent methyltransferase
MDGKMNEIYSQDINCHSFEEFENFASSPANNINYISKFESDLIDGENFIFPGRCAVCNLEANFYVDHQYCSMDVTGRRIPNWRERLVCPHCGLNNRMRASVAFLFRMSNPSSVIYLTENVTPLYQAVSAKRAHTVGSEYLRDGTLPGATNATGVRHEDVTALTFPDDSLDLIGTFDVLEHVPDYRRAMAEFFRCLKPGGTALMTVPILLSSALTVCRATVDTSGSITHILPPEIHGDPLDPNGALAFYNFGWDFVEALTEAGFSDAGLSLYWNPQLGYLGGYQFLITARKAAKRVGAISRLYGLLRSVRRSG